MDSGGWTNEATRQAVTVILNDPVVYAGVFDWPFSKVMQVVRRKLEGTPHEYAKINWGEILQECIPEVLEGSKR